MASVELVATSVIVVAAVAVVALPVNAPTKAVDVILVAPVTTPASTLIVPSSNIAEPEAGSILIAAPESKVSKPAESISIVPSAVIWIFAAAAAASVVTMLNVPLVPAVNTAVSLALPVMVITLPLIATSSITALVIAEFVPKVTPSIAPAPISTVANVEVPVLVILSIVKVLEVSLYVNAASLVNVPFVPA